MDTIIKYRILAPTTFPAGAVLALAEAQAAPRRHALKALDDGVFEATQPVQFKAGELVGYVGDLPKAYGNRLEDAAKPIRTTAAPATAGEGSDDSGAAGAATAAARAPGNRSRSR